MPDLAGRVEVREKVLSLLTRSWCGLLLAAGWAEMLKTGMDFGFFI